MRVANCHTAQPQDALSSCAAIATTSSIRIYSRSASAAEFFPRGALVGLPWRESSFGSPESAGLKRARVTLV
jgi:hypothetical protein